MDEMLRHRLMMQPFGQPSNQIWYDADGKATLYSPSNVVRHTFKNGRGVLTINKTITECGQWLRNSSIKAAYLPDTVTVLGNFAFRGCNSLEKIVLPEGLESIGEYAFYQCTLLDLESLPASVRTLNRNAFESCTHLTLALLPEGISLAGIAVFQNCRSIRLTSLPRSITSIPNQTFYGCTSIALTSLNDTVTNLGLQAFYGCTGIQSLTIPIVTPPTLGASVFNATTFPIYVPAESVKTYKAASEWSNYKNRIFAIPE